MGAFHLFETWPWQVVAMFVLLLASLASSQNIIPGNACGLQTEIKVLDALGNHIFD